MRFATERSLQDYCLQVLRAKGIVAQAEVWTDRGVRADIVTDDAVIELKKVLNRDGIYQAVGQAMTYQKHFRRPLLWIVGQMPSSPAERATALSVAKAVSGNGVRVSFIEQDPFWQLNSPLPLPLFGSLLPSLASASTSIDSNWQPEASPSTNWQPEVSPSAEVLKLLAVVVGVAIVAFGTTALRQLPLFTTPAQPVLRFLPPLAASPLPPQPGASPAASASVVPSPSNVMAQVQFCQGDTAEFRSQPSAPASLVGLLGTGTALYLTGQQVQADGVVWVEALLPLPTGGTQSGWLASCFVQFP